MNAESTVTYTLRLAKDLRLRLERSASHRGMSINQLILDLVDQHYQAAGFVPGKGIKSGGRNLEIRIKDKHHPPGMPTCSFFVDDPSREREVACYTFGFSSQFMWQVHIEEADQYKVIEEIGLALIHYYNRLGRNITKLEWDQFPTISNQRILQVQDAKTKNGSYILSVESFLCALQEGLWDDRLERIDGKPSGANISWARSDQVIDSIQEKTTMAAITLLPMGSGYSAVLLPDVLMSGGGRTGGRMFNNLKELQEQLKAWDVRADQIPQEDFSDSRLIELPGSP